MSKSIRLVSFNVEFNAAVTRGYWQYAEFFWKYWIPHNINDIDEIVDMIIDENADIVTFTEMEGVSRRTHHRDYLQILTDTTNLKKCVFYPVNRWWFDIGNRGNAIVTKYEIVESQNIKLETKIENRYLSFTKIKIDDKIINVLTTQLSLGKKDRRKEFQHIVRVINETKGPTIFAGDLNTQDEEELKVLNGTRLKRIETTDTFPSWNPKRRIDYIFHSPEFEVVESYVLDKVKVSDHLPVVVELKLNGNSEKKIVKKPMKKIISKKNAQTRI